MTHTEVKTAERTIKILTVLVTVAIVVMALL